MLTIRIV
jgi:hypothetical protein